MVLNRLFIATDINSLV